MLDYKVTYSQMKEWLAECAQKADPRASAPFYTLPVKLSRFLRKLVRRPPPPPLGRGPKGRGTHFDDVLLCIQKILLICMLYNSM